MSTIPEDLRYTDTHEWLEDQGDGSYRVGITDHAQEQLGDLVFVELPEVGSTYTTGAECAVVESVKSASDLYCPVDGEIVEVNTELEDSPEVVNTDPYGGGWIYRLKPVDPGSVDELLDADGYAESLAE